MKKEWRFEKNLPLETIIKIIQARHRNINRWLKLVGKTEMNSGILHSLRTSPCKLLTTKGKNIMKKPGRKDLNRMIKMNTTSNKTNRRRMPPIGWHGKNTASVTLRYKNAWHGLIMRKHQTNSSWGNLQDDWSTIFKMIKAIKVKDRLRNIPEWGRPERTGVSEKGAGDQGTGRESQK